MAGDTPFGLHELLPAGTAAGYRVEVMGGIEVGHDIRHLLPGELRHFDPALLHPGPHGEPVIPHEPGELREADVVSPAELGADLTPLAAYRVADRTLLVAKKRLAAFRARLARSPR
jgi:hypothetical protein